MARYSKAAQKAIAQAIEAGKDCTHPETETIGFGVFCTKCKLRVALVSDEQANDMLMSQLTAMFGGK